MTWKVPKVDKHKPPSEVQLRIICNLGDVSVGGLAPWWDGDRWQVGSFKQKAQKAD